MENYSYNIEKLYNVFDENHNNKGNQNFFNKLLNNKQKVNSVELRELEEMTDEELVFIKNNLYFISKSMTKDAIFRDLRKKIRDKALFFDLFLWLIEKKFNIKKELRYYA